ncbi:MAG: EAL domain-containing protein [Gallionella sp.]|jgi:diguanylate cyclase (GGDEF)-like protein/PAS domain S-box-containing protein
MINNWWHSLRIQTKLTILIQVSLFVVLVFAQRWIMSNFEAKILESAQSRAVEAADGIINGMNMLMLTGQISDPKNRALFIQKMGRSQGIRELRIFRSEQVKRQFGTGLPEEQPVDEVDRNVLSSGRPYFNQTEENPLLLRAVIPFVVSRNFRGTDCLACHKVEVGSVNGAASIKLDLSEELNTIKSINRWLWAGQLALQSILFFVIGFVLQSFTRPVRRLKKVMIAMRAGNLSRRVDIDSQDEIGQMASAFNALADNLQKSLSDVRAGEAQLKLSAQVFVNSREAIVITDVENNIIQVNKAFTEITGYSPEEVIGKNPRMLSSGQQDREFYRNMWETLLKLDIWQGELMDRRKDGEVYPKWLSITVVRDEKGDISNFIGLFSDITERIASYERIQYLAHFDALTDLPNRSLLKDHLNLAIEMAKRSQTQLAILFLDLDRFKIVNDSLGHHAGDLLLKIVSERLKNCTRKTDTVARLGGDEFVVLLSNIRESSDAARVAKKVIDAVAAPFLLEGTEANLGTSIGIAIYPDNGLDGPTLIKNADAAMYHAKENERNNFQFFSPVMNDKAFEQLELENDLRLALKREEFFLQYQPQIDISTGKIVGAEALIRWQHPKRGLVPPNNFIALAERCGLIVSIGAWVFRTACLQNIAWQKEGLAPILIAVNIAAQQFKHKNFKNSLVAILEETGVDPHFMELEITESAIMENAEAILNTLHSLKEIGFHLSIDDFGTGYSSLSYLKHFPIDKLKIDRSFVMDITEDSKNNAIIETIIHLGYNLQIKVIAEGVETAEQLATLEKLRCDEIQGYYFSRPLSPQDFAAFTRSRANG